MSRDEGEFTYESIRDCGSIVRFFDALSEGFRSGRLVLANDDEQIELDPYGLSKFDHEARKKDCVKLSTEVSWKADQDAAGLDGNPLVIKA